MCPYGGRWFGGDGPPWTTGEMCAHVLLIETDQGLVIVDTGFGLDQVRTPKLIGQPLKSLIRPRLDEGQTALRQVKALGFSVADVRHLVPTHLDVDHAGGLPDFPDAELHVWRPEMEAIQNPRLKERPRVMKHLFEHGPNWHPHDLDGDEWMGFEAVRPLPGTDAEILIVPLPGHSRGHSVIAVKDSDGWLLHCGDAYFHRNQVATPASCPPGLRAFQAVAGLERKRRLQNEERLRELNERKGGDGGEIRMFCAHDAKELERHRSGAANHQAT
jgi:glyoxylase-like metal-dependent hydrolase (beta-lactamase superfamily II)